MTFETDADDVYYLLHIACRVMMSENSTVIVYKHSVLVNYC